MPTSHQWQRQPPSKQPSQTNCFVSSWGRSFDAPFQQMQPGIGSHHIRYDLAYILREGLISAYSVYAQNNPLVNSRGRACALWHVQFNAVSDDENMIAGFNPVPDSSASPRKNTSHILPIGHTLNLLVPIVKEPIRNALFNYRSHCLTLRVDTMLVACYSISSLLRLGLHMRRLFPRQTQRGCPLYSFGSQPAIVSRMCSASPLKARVWHAT